MQVKRLLLPRELVTVDRSDCAKHVNTLRHVCEVQNLFLVTPVSVSI
jgi:hypothetical protein